LRDDYQGTWILADNSDLGSWEFDEGSTSGGTWYSTSDEGTFYLDPPSQTMIATSNVETGIWYAPDGAEGEWTFSENEGGRWAVIGGSAYGVWEYDTDSNISGTWFDEANDVSGTWSSTDYTPTIKVAINDSTGVWYAPDQSSGSWSYNEDNTGGEWTKDDNTDIGEWAFDDGSDLSGTWWNTDNTDSGVWMAHEDAPLIRFATTTRQGVWHAADGSYGTWTAEDDAYSGSWIKDDESQAGSWSTGTESDLAGDWWTNDDKFSGTWSSNEGETLIKIATSTTTGVWYAPDESTGYFNTNDERTGGYWEKDDVSDSGIWSFDEGSELSGNW
jgi:hypothetical protein